MSKNILIFVCLLMVNFGWSQQKESDRLKKDQQELLKKIDFTEKLLQDTKQSQTNISESLNLLDRKIQYRQDLLNNLDIQLSQIDAEIANLQIEIIQLEQQIIKHKEQYKKMIVQAYNMRNDQAALIFILSSESFNQANKRMEYLDQLQKYRKDQIRKITSAKEELEAKLALLETKRNEKKNLASSKVNEQSKYIKDREKQKVTIEELKGKEQQLQDELAEQKRKNKELQNAINAAINKEILAEKKKNNNKPPSMEDTKEIELSNKGFEANKGRLPWPVKKGEVSRGFGRQPHPVYSTVFTNNDGIDISTVKGSTVRSVYEGEVSSIVVIGGAGKAVIIKHGNYRTIYSNLQETYVSSGDKVTAKQEIGALLVNPNGTSVVHFEIRLVSAEGNISIINPTYWLYR
ncbi:peptidoglycan DD-metalloendopeptidase family protein [Paracrocinitomix mangrovi]|uniref:murein hydrolase activator EnvC family protein n=1 Tax=Paracrocinitomix mangrovi TaxID=2862509 RepID=UPI001C8E0E0E|nr:peptidoglycan DD-metalloendopeptidase family protein [Paracrocinitomix mangrovi]UKN00817.1 peptidoglycan DD-metalloendopeptidase family protein [Paracrocinitomix mangrovi]